MQRGQIVLGQLHGVQDFLGRAELAGLGEAGQNGRNADVAADDHAGAFLLGIELLHVARPVEGLQHRGLLLGLGVEDGQLVAADLVGAVAGEAAQRFVGALDLGEPVFGHGLVVLLANQGQHGVGEKAVAHFFEVELAQLRIEQHVFQAGPMRRQWVVFLPGLGDVGVQDLTRLAVGLPGLLVYFFGQLEQRLHRLRVGVERQMLGVVAAGIAPAAELMIQQVRALVGFAHRGEGQQMNFADAAVVRVAHQKGRAVEVGQIGAQLAPQLGGRLARVAGNRQISHRVGQAHANQERGPPL